MGLVKSVTGSVFSGRCANRQGWEVVAFRVHRTPQEASLEYICETRVLPAFRALCGAESLVQGQGGGVFCLLGPVTFQLSCLHGYVSGTNSNIRSHALKHLWSICHLQTAVCDDQMAWLDVQSGGRKEDPKFQVSLAIQQNSVLKISKQPTRNSEKM